MFKGQFKFKTASGIPYTYVNGDKVVYEGKIYEALNTTQFSPIQSSKDWKYLSVSQPYRGTYPPVSPKENQLWISDDGIMYVYFYDGNSYQWIST
jgi:hypothetical protein